jgi:hypothetical protein
MIHRIPNWAAHQKQIINRRARMPTMSDVAVDPTELTKCADYLEDAATAAAEGKTAVTGVMTGPTGADSVPYTHGSISNEFSEALKTAMAQRDSAADAVVKACKDLAASLRQAASAYSGQDQDNADSLNNQLS